MRGFEKRRNDIDPCAVTNIMKWISRLIFAASFVFSSLSVPCAAAPDVMKFDVDGVERQALVFLPAKPQNAPVVLAFHGHGGNMRFAARGMHFQDQWPEAIVVYPQGLPTPSLLREDKQGTKPGWQHRPGESGDRDLKFVDTILRTLREQYSIDQNRVYATGFSNGGFFSYLLWATRPELFAAFAPGAGLILPDAIPTQPRPVLHYGGRSDRLVKFSEQEKTIELARKTNHCASAGQPCGPLCTLYRSDGGTPVQAVIHPGGHLYPPPITPVIVKFFQDHPRH